MVSFFKKEKIFLSRSEFKKQALEIFETYGYQCQYCGGIFRDGLHPHHRVFKSQGGDDRPENIAPCCWKCHHDHGKLKNKKLISERDYDIIQSLSS
jgi:5-methylcytosine-specific restriction endonuclease McrA